MAQKSIRPKLWFTSDPHAGHRNILKFCPKRSKAVGDLKNISKHDDIIVKRWNSVVKPEDTVIIAGDITIGRSTEYVKKFISRLNGKLILVRGNHDRKGYHYYIKLGFAWVCEEMRLNVAGRRVLISHYPYRLSKLKRLWLGFKLFVLREKLYDSKLMDKRPVDDGSILLHGHTHQQDKVRGNMIHIGLDSWDMFPVSEDSIQKLISRMKK